ncbi:Uncharacterised protein [uncultured archaeon]|nr:Uncharacterised protein [uncultured archaeon]
MPIFNHTGEAGEDLTEKLYHGIKLNSSGKMVTATAASRNIGILQEVGKSGEEVVAMSIGISPGKLGGSVTANDDLTTDADGHFVTAVAGQPVTGIAMESGSSGEEIEILVLPQTPGAFPVAERGDTLFYNGSNWVVRHHGTSGQLWITKGHGADPDWGDAYGYCVVPLHMNLADIADGDLLTDYVPGFAGSIVKLSARAAKAATTAGKASTIHAEIGSTPTTGGSLALTSANMTPLGKVVDASAITAANTFSATDAISLVAASTTAFVEGAVDLILVLKPIVNG